MSNKLRQYFRFAPFSKKQRQVLNWWTESSPVKDMDGIIADGSIRSGKTVSMSLGFVLWAMTSFERQSFGMCGKTIGSFRRNVLASLKLMLRSRGYQVLDHRADNMLTIRRGTRENYFYIFGGKDERSQDLIQGITLAGLLCDEVALMPESFVNQATARCSVAGSKFWFNCNPEGPFHWFKLKWIDEARKKHLLYLHFTMADNLSLSEVIKERYRSQWSGVFYDRYIRGMWRVAEGLIYDMFSEREHVIDARELATLGLDKGSSVVSCDYGTQNATVFLLWQRGADGVSYAVREYYYSGRDKRRQKTDAEYADDLVSWLDGIRPRHIIVDPSAASFIAELSKRGFFVVRANNDVADGIRTVGSELTQGRLKISSACKHTREEFATYAWDPKAAEKGLDKPLKEHDHCMDALRYYVYTERRRVARLNPVKGGI